MISNARKPRLLRSTWKSAAPPGSWQEEESEEQADRWMRISVDGVEEITWHTA